MVLHVYGQGATPITPNIIKSARLTSGNTTILETTGTNSVRYMVIWIPTNGETTFEFECSGADSLMYTTATAEPATGSAVFTPTILSGSSPFTITIPSGRTYLVISIGTSMTADYHYPIWDKAIYRIGNPNNVSSYWKDEGIKSSLSNTWAIRNNRLLQEYLEGGNTVDISKAYQDDNLTINYSTKQLQRGSGSTHQATRYWPVTPGDTVAFKYGNTSGKTITKYNDSSIQITTGNYYTYVANMAIGSVIQPMTDLHTETIDGEIYYVFTVPSDVNGLAVTFVYGSGSYDPKDYIRGTILYKGTEGWIKY